MDPFELLKKDHEKVSTLFKQIESASGDGKMRIFRQLKQELDVHAHIEEKIFYPALEREKQTREITLEAYEEHRVVKDLLSQLDAATSAGEDWDARLTVLKENVEHHVEEEEGELFDKANDVLTGEQADALGDQMQAEKNRQLGYSADQPRRAKGPDSKSASRKTPAKATKKTAAKKSTGKAARKSAGKAAKKSVARKTGASKSTGKATKKRSTKSTSQRGGKSTSKRR
ncbi:MAG TPA: hemerythrin domain-containing protein [Pyrinomonadaceae bacterium]|nr:hemerythrin domain-containing protein [Pyrinomonadaceae bacterium]